MLDFLKLYITDILLMRYLENHELLEWVKSEDRFNYFDNEVIKTKTIKQYKGILFCFYSKRVEVLFKPHYYFNKGLHNANDFKAIDCINVILELKNTFKIDLHLLEVKNIEFGINISSPICIKKLINFLQFHKRNEFKSEVGLTYGKRSSKANRKGINNKYKSIKAYAKGIQAQEYADIDTFRFEVKSKESKYIKQFGICTANDLLNFDCYINVANKIVEEFEKVLLLDCVTDFTSLKEIEKAKIKDYLNPMTWFDISQHNDKNKFNKERTKYYKLINKIPNNLKNRLTKAISDKLEYLKSGYISTQKEIEIKAIGNINTGYISTHNNNKTNLFENSKSGYHSNIYKDGIVTSTELETNIKKDEVKKLLLSYQEQKKAIEEYNRLAVLNYNSRGVYKLD
ncbi:MAG: hypothetical protein R2805_02340 [Flavobacterium sp.]|uniref:hypothetical protein n=1 Tax=Flavobacterium sp. TaxID=239 RepID=UPI0035274F59